MSDTNIKNTTVQLTISGSKLALDPSDVKGMAAKDTATIANKTGKTIYWNLLSGRWTDMGSSQTLTYEGSNIDVTFSTNSTGADGDDDITLTMTSSQ